MAYSDEHGPPDFDATHAWDPATGDPPPVINDPGGDPPVLPWVLLTAPPTNWWGSAEIEDRRAPRTYGDGEIPYPSRKLGKTIVYELEVRAKTRETLRALMWGLVQGFDNTSDEGTMTVTPYATPGGIAWVFYARVLEFTPDASITFDDRSASIPFKWGAQLTLRLSDPQFYLDNFGS